MSKTVEPRKIAIIDSGVGGLSILQACVRDMPSEFYIYCSDNKNYPYGTKSEAGVIECVHHLVQRLQAEYQPDLFVVGCNTASTVALPTLREQFSVPFVGVVPAIKPAAQLSQTKSMALLATPGTVRRTYVDELINEFASGIEVIKVGSRRLVDIAEQKILTGEAAAQTAIYEEIRTLENTSVDTIVLGCTHFKLIEEELKQALPSVLNWVDSSASIAKRVAHLIQYSQPHPQNTDVQGVCHLTAPVNYVSSLQQYIASFLQARIEVLT